MYVLYVFVCISLKHTYMIYTMHIVCISTRQMHMFVSVCICMYLYVYICIFIDPFIHIHTDTYKYIQYRHIQAIMGYIQIHTDTYRNLRPLPLVWGVCGVVLLRGFEPHSHPRTESSGWFGEDPPHLRWLVALGALSRGA